MNRLICTLFGCLALSGFAGVTTLNLDYSNFEFKAVHVDQQGVNFTYRINDIIGFDLTAFAGDSGTSLLNTQGAGNVPVGSRAALLDADLRFDTGVINPARSPTAMTLLFDQPVFNNRGDDVVLFEWNTGGAGDPFQVRINGITQQYTTGSYNGQHGGPVPVNAQVIGGTPSTLFQLENNGASSNFDLTQNIFGIGVNLSDFGVPKGASVTSIQLGSAASGATPDFVYIAGLKLGHPSVPEPSTGMFLFLGVGLIRFFRSAMDAATREQKAAA
ncbi:MAG: hypothetical protein ACI9TH_004110 [Kiritimatiellia bacterium]|jgi:hypothetical protein